MKMAHHALTHILVIMDRARKISRKEPITRTELPHTHTTTLHKIYETDQMHKMLQTPTLQTFGYLGIWYNKCTLFYYGNTDTSANGKQVKKEMLREECRADAVSHRCCVALMSVNVNIRIWTT